LSAEPYERAIAAAGAGGRRFAGQQAWRRLKAAAQVTPFTLLLVGILLVPVGIFATYSFRPTGFLGVESGVTFENYSRVIHSHTDVTIILRTLALGLGVAFIVTSLAFVIAYALAFRIRRRAALIVLGVVLAASISSLLVRIYAWATILGNNGLINSTLTGLGITDKPLTFLLFGYFAIVVTMVYVYLPVATLILYGAFQNVDPRTLEASRDLGAGRWRTIARVTAPQVSGGLLAAFGFVAILAWGDYVTPSLMGGVRGQTIGTLIRDTALVQGDYAMAAALALTFGVAMLLTICVLALAWRASRPLRGYAGRVGDRLAHRLARRRRQVMVKRSLSRPLTFALVGYLVLPTVLVIVFSFNDKSTVGLPWRAFTTRWYPEIVHRAGFTDAVTTSAQIAVAAVVASLVLGTLVALALIRLSGIARGALWLAVMLPFLVPGVLWGASLNTIAAEQGLLLGPGVTTLVHILLAIPLVVLVVYVRLSGVDRRIFEAARDLGAAPARVWRTVTIPIMLPSLVGAALFAAAYSLDELFVTNFTIGSANTVPVWVLGQIRYGFRPGINALGVMLLTGTLLVFALSGAAMRRPVSANAGGSDDDRQ
jgi:ABC-type spermidine/putrescine transport system permease subunit II